MVASLTPQEVEEQPCEGDEYNPLSLAQGQRESLACKWLNLFAWDRWGHKGQPGSKGLGQGYEISTSPSRSPSDYRSAPDYTAPFTMVFLGQKQRI